MYLISFPLKHPLETMHFTVILAVRKQKEQCVNLVKVMQGFIQILKYIVQSIKRKNSCVPYYPGYKAMALFTVQGHPWPYNEYKAMTL